MVVEKETKLACALHCLVLFAQGKEEMKKMKVS